MTWNQANQNRRFRVTKSTGGKGKSSTDKSKSAASSGAAKSRSARAGLQFPVGRVHRLLRKGNYAQRVVLVPHLSGCSSRVSCFEILELAGNAAVTTRRLVSFLILAAASATTRSSKGLGNVTIREGGVLPNIHNVLLPKKTKLGGKPGDKPGSQSQEY
ncbi:hypothetical protein BSLG_008500 [Batrachochytrium salamandrivorans]|nr:hypothetical protein BSLG_008500 [Batrachochytrium salamandrivorans]